MKPSMGWISGFAFFFAVLSTPFAQADGGFSLSLRGQTGFSLLTLKEHDGMREGTLDGEYVASKRTDKELIMVMGDRTDTLSVEKDGNNLYYNGLISQSSEPTDFQYYPEKDGYRIQGHLAKTEFQLLVDQKKGELFIYWIDKENDYEFQITLNRSKTEAGGCSGNMAVQSGTNYEEIAQLFCHSSGSMQDAFFTSPDDAIAWLIHLQVYPTEDDPNPQP